MGTLELGRVWFVMNGWERPVCACMCVFWFICTRWLSQAFCWRRSLINVWERDRKWESVDCHLVSTTLCSNNSVVGDRGSRVLYLQAQEGIILSTCPKLWAQAWGSLAVQSEPWSGSLKSPCDCGRSVCVCVHINVCFYTLYEDFMKTIHWFDIFIA